MAEAVDFFAGGGENTRGTKDFGPMADVGLGWVATARPAADDALGGERQRLKLAAQMADPGDIYVLDEPTTGLHLADVQNLLGMLDRLVDSGKSVIVIEHHQAVMAHADWIIDLGPGAGHDGGRVVFEGTPPISSRLDRPLTGLHLADYVLGADRHHFRPVERPSGMPPSSVRGQRHAVTVLDTRRVSARGRGGAGVSCPRTGRRRCPVPADGGEAEASGAGGRPRLAARARAPGYRWG